MGRNARRLLVVAAVAETATGLVLLALPSMVVRLLFGAETADVGSVVSRLTGISLIALGLACWPGRDAGSLAALLGMLTYSLLAALYLGYLGIVGEWVGILLWPAVGVHAVLSALLVWAWIRKLKIRRRIAANDGSWPECRQDARQRELTPNNTVEPTSSGGLRPPTLAAHRER